jgi:hypothetical protein
LSELVHSPVGGPISVLLFQRRIRRSRVAQLQDLEATIMKADLDLVIIGTPIDLTRVIKIDKPYQPVRYELQEIGRPTLEDILKKKIWKKEVNLELPIGFKGRIWSGPF